eukprot:447336_1
MDLAQHIETINALNIDHDESSALLAQLTTKKMVDSILYVVSDVDEEMIILIEFKQMVALDSIKLYSFENIDTEIDTSPPKQIHIYKINNVNKNFDDIKSMKPTQSIKCSSKKLSKGQSINLKKKAASAIKFKSIRYLAVYIESNQNDTENTHLNGITFKGKPNEHEQNIISIEKKEIESSIDLTMVVKKGQFKNKNKNIVFDETDTDNMHKFINIAKEYNKPILFDGIDSTYLMKPYRDCRNDNMEQKTTTRFDEEIINNMVSLGIATRDECIRASQMTDNYKDPNAVYEKLEELLMDDSKHHQIEDTSQLNCVLLQCTHLNRLIIALKMYNEFIAHNKETDVEKKENILSNKKRKMNDIFNDNYDSVSVVNDFHHLLDFHADQFEQIYNILVEQCNNGIPCTVSNCIMMHRNCRDRNMLRSNDAELNRLYFNQSNINDIINQQLLDTIHCYYAHSFDVGHKLSQEQKQTIEEMVKMDDTHDSKNIDDAEENNLIYDKIVASIYQFISRNMNFNHGNSAKYSTILGNVDDLKYSFGFKFFYWDYYKNNVESVDPAFLDSYDSRQGIHTANDGSLLGDFYVAPKYVHFKTEMLNNDICSLNIVQWNNYVHKANQYLNCHSIKMKRCKEKDTRDAKYADHYYWNTDKYYGMKAGCCMSVEHAVAIMIRCNDDVIQMKLAETYRRNLKHETAESVIKRHSNYANFGRLLRELVSCFGEDNRDALLYHGTSIESQFPSTNAFIKGPCSTTRDYVVAVNFAGKSGMILELHVQIQKYKTGSFSCHYISDFTNEMEIFFIGGIRKFSILSIIKTVGLNYELYVRALARLNRYLFRQEQGHHEENNYKSLSDNYESSCIDQICFRMVVDELHRLYPENKNYFSYKSIPSYVRKLMQYQFFNTKTIKQMSDLFLTGRANNFYYKMFHSLFYYDYGWIKLKLLTTLFPNLREIGLGNH